MRFEWFVALRYLRSPNRPTVLRLVTAFSVLGVTAGVATLVVALAMNTGFRETLQDRLLGVTAHISLTRPGSGGIQDYEALATKLSRIPGVSSVTPAVYQTVLMTFGGESRGVVAKGIEPAREAAADEALHKLSSGKLDFQPDGDGIDAMLLGKQLADDWKLAPGDYVTLTSPQGRLTPFGLLPRTRRFRVAGIFDSGFYDYDANWCFVKMDAAQALAGASDVVNVLEFRLQKPEAAPAIAGSTEALQHLSEWLNRTEDSAVHPMAATLLHAAVPGWRPGPECRPRLSGAYLARAIWPGLNLCRVDLQSANLKEADLSWVNLENSRANHAQFQRATLDGAQD